MKNTEKEIVLEIIEKLNQEIRDLLRKNESLTSKLSEERKRADMWRQAYTINLEKLEKYEMDNKER